MVINTAKSSVGFYPTVSRHDNARGHRDRYIGSLFRVDEPVPVLLVQTVDISNDRQLTIF